MANRLKYKRAERYRLVGPKLRPVYFATCGHEVRSPVTKLCRTCYLSKCQRLANGGYPVSRLRNGQRLFIHREKAERAVGRRLKSNEVVHHVNLVKTDNRNCNLVVCTKAYHLWLHQEYARRFAKEHFNAERF